MQLQENVKGTPNKYMGGERPLPNPPNSSNNIRYPNLNKNIDSNPYVTPNKGGYLDVKTQNIGANT